MDGEYIVGIGIVKKELLGSWEDCVSRFSIYVEM
jgi:hypothetical protein